MTTSAEVTTLIRSAKLAFPHMKIGQLIWEATLGEDISKMPDDTLASYLRQYMTTQLNKRISLSGNLTE